MNWNTLNNISQLAEINEESKSIKVMLFKHSTRCSISSMALSRIESSWKDSDSNFIKPYYLDLIAHRDISNLIAEQYGVEHQSPQALIISNGKCIYHASHTNIKYSDIIS
ncbi:MAG: bacillithiol system redox-active protein YtxJ [Bacteroidia bacterium]